MDYLAKKERKVKSVFKVHQDQEDQPVKKGLKDHQVRLDFRDLLVNLAYLE